jgi:Coenzyme PQQ synthesis protein D (PqqD)
MNGPRLLPAFEVIASDDGFVVHDARRDVVHYLNQTAAIVLSLCDGNRSTAQIAELLANQFGLGEAPHDDVIEIVTKFQNEGLVTSGGE